MSHTSQEALADGIGSRCMNGRLENLDVTCRRHASKARPKFAVVITNEILGCLPIRGGFPKLLGHPGIGGRSRHAHMDHLARLQFYDKEGKERPKEEIGYLQEVTRPDLLGMRARDRSATSDLVVGVCELLSYISGSCACTPVGPVSTIPHECARHPRVDFPSPFA